MTDTADVGRAIADNIPIPTDSVSVVIEHVMMARITILHANGHVDVDYQPYWSCTIDPETHADMARQLTDEARRRIGG